MQKVLVVCIGNICRSPMAAAVLREQLPEMSVESAGLQALVNRPADPIACELMAQRGLSLAGHRARQIDAGMCQSADLILVMDRAQRRMVQERFLSAAGKVFRIGEFADQDVPDPFRLPRNVFQESLAMIDDGAQQWADRISRIFSR